MFNVEAKDKDGWYDHSSHATVEAAIEEVRSFFDPAAVRAGHVKIVDVENMLYFDFEA